jgi:hypothetical protein
VPAAKLRRNFGLIAPATTPAVTRRNRTLHKSKQRTIHCNLLQARLNLVVLTVQGLPNKAHLQPREIINKYGMAFTQPCVTDYWFAKFVRIFGVFVFSKSDTLFGRLMPGTPQSTPGPKQLYVASMPKSTEY